jgi:hypothetical protein
LATGFAPGFVSGVLGGSVWVAISELPSLPVGVTLVAKLWMRRPGALDRSHANPTPPMSDLRSGALCRKTTGVGAIERTRARRRSLRRIGRGEPASETTQISLSHADVARIRRPIATRLRDLSRRGALGAEALRLPRIVNEQGARCTSLICA